MKKISVVLNILLFILICTLGFNLSGRLILVDALADGGISHTAADRMMDAVVQEYPDASMDQIEAIQDELESNQAVKKMVGDYLDQAVKAVAEDQPVTAPADVKDEIGSMAGEALVSIESVMGGGSANDLRVRLIEEGSEISDAISYYVQGMSEHLRFGPMKLLVTTYWFISSGLCRLLCIVGLILLLGAIFLIKKRLLPMLDSCKWPILLSGIFLGGLVPLVAASAWRVIANRFLGGRVYGINTSILIQMGAIFVAVGAVLFVISFIKKK